MVTVVALEEGWAEVWAATSGERSAAELAGEMAAVSARMSARMSVEWLEGGWAELLVAAMELLSD
jgi:hypothetical protein